MYICICIYILWHNHRIDACLHLGSGVWRGVVDDDDTKMNDYLLLYDVSIFPIDKIYTYKMCVCNISMLEG